MVRPYKLFWVGIVGTCIIVVGPLKSAQGPASANKPTTNSTPPPDTKPIEEIGQADDKPTVIVTRFYDIRALLAPSSDFGFDNSPRSGAFVYPPNHNWDPREYEQGASIDVATEYETHGPTRAMVIEELCKVIRDTVEPDSWRTAGGNLGTIAESQRVLIVTQSVENQKKVADLLRKLSARRHRTVRTAVDMLLLKSDDLAKVRKASPSNKDCGALAPLDPVLLEKLTAENVHFHADLLGQDGQTVHVVSGREKSITVSQSLTVGTDVAGYTPIKANIGGGIAASGDSRCRS